MSPTEFWHIYDAKQPPKMYGKLTETEVDRLENFLDEAQNEWQAQQ